MLAFRAFHLAAGYCFSFQSLQDELNYITIPLLFSSVGFFIWHRNNLDPNSIDQIFVCSFSESTLFSLWFLFFFLDLVQLRYRSLITARRTHSPWNAPMKVNKDAGSDIPKFISQGLCQDFMCPFQEPRLPRHQPHTLSWLWQGSTSPWSLQNWLRKSFK